MDETNNNKTEINFNGEITLKEGHSIIAKFLGVSDDGILVKITEKKGDEKPSNFSRKELYQLIIDGIKYRQLKELNKIKKEMNIIS